MRMERKFAEITLTIESKEELDELQALVRKKRYYEESRCGIFSTRAELSPLEILILKL